MALLCHFRRRYSDPKLYQDYVGREAGLERWSKYLARGGAHKVTREIGNSTVVLFEFPVIAAL